MLPFNADRNETMKSAKSFLLILYICLMACAGKLYGQEVAQSAEVFLDEYSDVFQEKFFEALKQRGIENYDKAINLLLECKVIDTSSIAVDHELAKAFLASRNYSAAQDYAIQTLIKEPTNKWYLHTLLLALRAQGNTITNIQESVPYENAILKENLAYFYFEQKNYNEALNVLKGINGSDKSNMLRLKIQDSLGKLTDTGVSKEDLEVNETEVTPLQRYTKQIEEHIKNTDFKAAEVLANEAIESFPLQPYFYYALGLAQLQIGKHQDAIITLESALEYLLEEGALANTIYETLAKTYTMMGNSSKANMYLSKIKSGS